MSIASLARLDLPPYLPGEVPPPGTNMGLLTPDGELMHGDVASKYQRVTAYRDRDPTTDLKSEIPLEGRYATVSTVYLGLDHQWSDGGPALSWETMVYIGSGAGEVGNDWQDYQWRYSTRAAAHSGHRVVVAVLEATYQSTASLIKGQLVETGEGDT